MRGDNLRENFLNLKEQASLRWSEEEGLIDNDGSLDILRTRSLLSTLTEERGRGCWRREKDGGPGLNVIPQKIVGHLVKKGHSLNLEKREKKSTLFGLTLNQEGNPRGPEKETPVLRWGNYKGDAEAKQGQVQNRPY